MFSFFLSQPSGSLSGLIQGIWSISVRQPEPLVKPLFADAGSGIIFNFGGNVTIGSEHLPEGVIMLPVKKRAENFVLAPGTQLAGVRFHPAMGYGLLGKHYSKPTLLRSDEDQFYNLYQIYADLRIKNSHEEKVKALYLWADKKLNFESIIPNSLEQALSRIDGFDTIEKICEKTELSQRQIERNFKLWLGMTPKHYQRILRVKKAIYFLQRNKNTNLAHIAQSFGFSDQAHMTREFRTIACITPGKI